ncbi:MAG: hypothetical protein ACJA1A_002976 [Saprospiraceae bacterium]|jgi:hypothetical protein
MITTLIKSDCQLNQEVIGSVMILPHSTYTDTHKD